MLLDETQHSFEADHNLLRVWQPRCQRRHTKANIVARSLTSCQLASNMNELTQESYPIHANIAERALAICHVTRYTNELTQERSPINANLAENALDN